jgi:hypothetical protein
MCPRTIINTLCALLALATVAIGLAASAAEASNEQYRNREKLAKTNAELQKLTTQMKALETEMRSIQAFSKAARAWFLRMQRVEAEIKEAQRDDQSTFDRTHQQDTLDHLYQERDSIMRLDGGATISGRTYSSLAALQSAFTRKGERGKTLREEYRSLDAEINKLRDERERLWDSISETTKADADALREEIRDLRETLDFVLTMLGDPKVWIVGNVRRNETKGIPFVHEDDAIWEETRRYGKHVESEISEYEANRGMGQRPKFEAESLASYLKYRRDQSDQAKLRVNRNIVPEMKRTIEERVARLEKMEQALAAEELAGCWLIVMPSSKRPSIDVRKDGDVYRGYIADPTGLAHFQRGHQLFTVKRKTPTAFTGKEFTFKKDGTPVRQSVRIDVDKGGVGLTYRSNNNFRMHRCQ